MKIDNKSYINKDFQTIYPELVDLFSKLTNRLDVRATNESDPMVVLLKLMGFTGDKQNYNIDQNVLQTFLQTVTQLEAFRSQAEINGYTMKYYESASTKVTLMYSGDEENLPIQFYPFETKFTDANNEVIYTMVGDDRTLGSSIAIGSIGTSAVCYAYEGEDVDFSINGVTTVQLANLNDENKLFFPEQMIASNIIFVKNADSSNWGEWTQVDNLNTTIPLSKVFKFGYDSTKNLPYIEFPNDIEEIIGNGLNVKYFRTQGVGGNIIAKKLTQLKNSIEGIDSNYLYVSNIQSALNGKDPESIDEAYKNYKRTVGTFDTLTTTQDFANYLFNVVNQLTSQPLVSNIQVTDRRTDTNLALPIISYDEFGASTVYQYDTFGINNGTITPFDLVLYPLTYITNISSDLDYATTFTPTDLPVIGTLLDALDGAQSVEHTYLDVASADLISKKYPYLYKNMYALNCRISTTHKVNGTEQLEILANVRQALYDNFNAREVEYGKEIDFDDLFDVIEGADTRIKNVSLDEPEVTTKVCLADGSIDVDDDAQYVDRVFKNVAAGRMELYEYNNDFKFEIGKVSNGAIKTNVTSVEPRLDLSLDDTNPYTLKQNQVVQLYAQSYGIDFNALYGVLYYFDGGTNETAIGRNEIHRLENDEVLFINTTQDNETYTLKYTATSKTKYNANGSVISTESLAEVIIQPNFDLETTTGGRHEVIVNGQTYMFNMLGTSDKISFMKKTTKKLTSPMLAYWFVNNANNELFTDNDAVHTHLLDEGEYLFLTDATKTQLTIFGSGTIISAPSGLLSNWELDRNNLVTLETFSSEDISTYGAISWVTLPISTTNYFEIKQQQVVTLTEGDKLNLLSGTLDLDDSNDHTYTFDLDEGIVYNDTNTIKSTNTLEWTIRTRLDLGISYDVGQQLTSVLNSYTEKVIVNGDTVNPITNCWLQAYDPIQTSTYTLTDNTKLFPYLVNNVVYHKGGSNEVIPSNIDGTYTIKIDSWASGDEIDIPLTQVSGYTSAFMLYFNKVSGTVSISCSEIDSNLNTGDTSLREGMNNIIINSTDDVATISISSDGNPVSANITILPLRVYNGYNSIFHLGNITDGVSTLTSKLATIKDKFYFLYNVPNAKAIDVTDYREASSLWEVNDVLNKKTLPQIDFDNSIIKIIKSSRQ